MKSAAVSEKNKALILVSLAVFAQCEMCIESNVASAIESGANKDYTPTQHKWVTDEHGNQCKNFRIFKYG